MFTFIKKHVWPIIVGLGTIIGLLVAFFPSLFNLELKRIAHYDANLNNLQDAQKFIDFLKNHQDTVVELNINYKEDIRYIYARDKKGEVIVTDDENDKDTEYSGYDIRPKIIRLNDVCLRNELDGNESFGAVDPEGHIFIKSEFKCIPFLRDFNFLRKKGEIGIWIPGEYKNSKGEDGGDDLSGSAYRIVITDASKSNSLFKWSIKDREKNADEMQLSGIFFINTFIDSHESDYGSSKGSEQTIDSMSPQWREENAGRDQIGIENIIVIELDPLSKKEMESKKY